MNSFDVWKELDNKIKMTNSEFQELTSLCVSIFNDSWEIKNKFDNILTKYKTEMSSTKKISHIYFLRNITYLRVSYYLACGSLCGPSRDLQRTVYETIMRGYLFLVDEKEINLFFSLIDGTIKPNERDALKKRKYWPFEFLLNKLYRKDLKIAVQELYNELSRYSHPSIKGALLDLGYSKESVEDCLKMIPMQLYGNIQMLTEGFLDELNEDLNNAISSALKNIADFIGYIPIFEPNQKKYNSKIKLKRGNFMSMLR